MKNSSMITGLILAGGQGSRMGGADKGLLLWQGKPLIEHALNRLSPQVKEIIISANRNQAQYEAWGHPVLRDEALDYPGPLAGLQAALTVCHTPLLACIPCDTPCFPLDLVAKMRETLERNPSTLITWATSSKGEHPVFLLGKKEIAPLLATYLAAGKRRVREFLLEIGGEPTWFDNEDAFCNLNTPEELKSPREIS